MTDTNLIVAFFGALFALANPFGNLPFFITYTKNLRAGVQKATALLLTIFLIVFFLIFFFIGNDILAFFGISIPAFEIAGGIIVMIIALSMVSGAHTETQKEVLQIKQKEGNKETMEEDIQEAESFLPSVLVPLGIPIYAGPGALSVVIIYGEKSMQTSSFAVIASIAVIIGICLIVCAVNLLSAPINRVLGPQGLEILVRIMGLILAAIAVTLLIDGLAAVSTVFVAPS